MECQIFNSDTLNGLAGDNGEQFCLFIRDLHNPLNSAWAWFHSLADAKNWAKTNDIEPKRYSRDAL